MNFFTPVVTSKYAVTVLVRYTEKHPEYCGWHDAFFINSEELKNNQEKYQTVNRHK